jgi:hypothetical protein
MPRFHVTYYPKGKHGKYPSPFTIVEAPDAKSVSTVVEEKFPGATISRINQEYSDPIGYEIGDGTFTIYRSFDEALGDWMGNLVDWTFSFFTHVVFPILGLIGLIWLIKTIWYHVPAG